MTYVIIDDFKQGMDRRKKRVSGIPGALWDGVNGHITRGGDFERRKKFVPKYNLPVNSTFGLAQTNNNLYTFGSATNPGVPAGVTYQRLVHPTGQAMTKVISTTSFSGKVYVIASFADGSIYHYYDGTRVTAWDAIAAANGSNATIAAALASQIALDPRYTATALGSVITIQANTAGLAFTLSSSAVNGGSVNNQTLVSATPQPNVVGVAETRASFTIRVDNGSPNDNSFLANLVIGGQLYVNKVNWTVSDANTARLIANKINNSGVTNGCTASVSGDTVTVFAPAGLGTSFNGTSVTAANTLSGSVPDFGITTPAGSYTNLPNGTNIGAFAGGVNRVVAVAQVSTVTVGGTFEPADIFTVIIDGVTLKTTGLASSMGTFAMTYSNKLYCIANSLVVFSAVGNPADLTGTGSGFISITNQSADNEFLVGLREYQNRIAIFSRFNTQVWLMAADPANNTFQQSIQNTGSLNGKSIIQYGNIDVFYLSDSGVRSIKARDSSNAPSVNDVGVAIDSFIQEYIAALSGRQLLDSNAAIEPKDGRHWLALKNRIFVYSFFPGSKVTAWTYYDLTDEVGSASVTEMVRLGQRMFIRAGDTVYLYGGDSGEVYPDDDEAVATLSLPFLSASSPGTIKGIDSFNVGLQGEWHAYLLPDPNDESLEIDIGIFTESTYNRVSNPVYHSGPLFAIKMVCSKAGYASVTSMQIHYDAEREKK